MKLLSVGPPGLDSSGYGEMQRRILLALEDLGWQITLRPFDSLNIKIEDRANAPRLKQMEENQLPPPGSPLLYFGPALLFNPDPDYYNIGFTMAEVDRISREWADRCNSMDEVWVPSRFNYNAFTSCGVLPEKLRIMHLGVDTQHFKPSREPKSGNKFSFLSCFELIPRKGCDTLMEAFCEEFDPGEPVELIIKSFENWGKHDPQGKAISNLLDDVQKKYLKTPSITLEKSVIPYSELPSLYKRADCQISASHGEGWNLPLMEAMACNIPVIAVNWSGHTEYLTDYNSFLIEAAGFTDANSPIYPDARWAVVDKRSLRRMMRYVVEHPLEVKQKGNRARRDVLRRFSINKIARQISFRLQHEAVIKKSFRRWLRGMVKKP
ncbi:MAG: glycosyltransferase family 4 protein [Bacillota bacterium]